MDRKSLKAVSKRRSTAPDFKRLTDGELVAYTKKGHPEAFQVLTDRYDALVRSIASKFLSRDPMALEDVCQETFLKALVKIDNLREPDRFKSWICAIARNQALDCARTNNLKASQEFRTDDGETLSWEIPASDSDPSELHDLSEVTEVIQDILKEIPDMYRYPISLRYEEDLEYQDIARLMGKPLGTVKSLIHRGKSLMLKELTRRTWSNDGAHVMAR